MRYKCVPAHRRRSPLSHTPYSLPEQHRPGLRSIMGRGGDCRRNWPPGQKDQSRVGGRIPSGPEVRVDMGGLKARTARPSNGLDVICHGRFLKPAAAQAAERDGDRNASSRSGADNPLAEIVGDRTPAERGHLIVLLGIAEGATPRETIAMLCRAWPRITLAEIRDALTRATKPAKPNRARNLGDRRRRRGDVMSGRDGPPPRN